MRSATRYIEVYNDVSKALGVPTGWMSINVRPWTVCDRIRIRTCIRTSSLDLLR